MVDRNTPVLETGNTTFDAFESALSRTWTNNRPSPLTAKAATLRRMFDTASAHGLARLFAAWAWIETKNHTWVCETAPSGMPCIPARFNNVMAVKVPTGQWATYPNYEVMADAWVGLIADLVDEGHRTIAQFVHRYAPPFENDSEAYIRQAVEEINALPFVPATPGGPGAPSPVPPSLDPWRPYPYPPMVDMLVQKPGERAGFDRVEFRRPLIRGFCTHITDGPQTQTLEFLRDFFGTGGARQWDALTDLGIEASGRIGVFNDWRDPARGGTRAGWANGGTDGLEGPGIAFFRKFPRINVHLVSCEHFARSGDRWTDAQIESTVEIRTAIFQEIKCSGRTYPIHQDWGTPVELEHYFFALKRCPDNPYISQHRAVVQAEVKRKLEAWQGGGLPPQPIPEPEPDIEYPFGMTRAQVEYYFGVLTRHHPDGETTEYAFDPNGPVSLAWLERCGREGKFPEAEEWRTFDTALAEGQEHFVTFEGGWVLYCPVSNQRAGWRWLDEEKGQNR